MRRYPCMWKICKEVLISTTPQIRHHLAKNYCADNGLGMIYLVVCLLKKYDLIEAGKYTGWKAGKMLRLKPLDSSLFMKDLRHSLNLKDKRGISYLTEIGRRI